MTGWLREVSTCVLAGTCLVVVVVVVVRVVSAGVLAVSVRNIW